MYRSSPPTLVLRLNDSSNFLARGLGVQNVTCNGYEARAPLSANSVLNWKNHIAALNLAQLIHNGKQIRQQENKPGWQGWG
jgi:hypothetical protein